MGHVVIMELLGSFVFTLAIVLSNNPLTVGLVLMAMVYIGGHISGGHYNPAISLASWVQRGLSNEGLLSYLAAQVLGAVLAVMVAGRIAMDSMLVTDVHPARVMDQAFVEMFLTIIFVLLVLTVAKASAYKGAMVQGLVIGLGFAGLIGLQAGVYLNPAAVLGRMIAGAFGGATWGTTQELLVYVVSPLLGGAVAAWLYSYLNDRK